MAIRSGNPALNGETFDVRPSGVIQDPSNSMTLDGTAVKTGFLGLIVFVSSVYTWSLSLSGQDALGLTLLWIGCIGGFLVAMITIFNKPLAPITSPIYAALEGLCLGGISGYYEKQYHGIVIEAIVLTMVTLMAMLFVYCTRIIKPSENFKLGVVSATGAVAVIYLIDMIGMFTGHWRVPLINDYGPLGILVSLFITGIAALNLVLDFDFIEKGVETNAPKYMEWYGAFGLMVTLIWLYLEILRLLVKVRRK